MIRNLCWLAVLPMTLSAQPYDLLIKGGQVIDPKNNIDAVMDVAVSGNRIARVASDIPASSAKRVADARGLVVTPGLLDIHVHVYAGTGIKGVLTGDSSVYPDTFSFRSGVTTMVDAGSSGWRNFADFRQRIIDRAQTRVLALINIVGGGMGITSENDPNDMDAEAAARMAKAHPDVVVGFKTAHYSGPGWPALDGAVKAGNLAGLPVMVDFGYVNEERNIRILMEDKLRKGDIYTHCYSGHRDEVVDGKVNPAMIAGRKRGIFFDVGHGGGSFYWNVAVPAFEQGFLPDSISTDLHTGSMNAGMKDMANVMSKVLNLGAPLKEVIRMSTWNPALEIRRSDLGHLDVGAGADITVLAVEKGNFGFIDSAGARRMGSQRLAAELTVRRGQIVWDRNGIAAQDWKAFSYTKREPAPPTLPPSRRN
ncbi:MAG: amidohydrolase/deacetylase family metallohydrolase [Bryobacterales bacterium]|nr:amidohydrolase/deacetylase family metallohydrolase [Bryobacterales bacterium]